MDINIYVVYAKELKTRLLGKSEHIYVPRDDRPWQPKFEFPHTYIFSNSHNNLLQLYQLYIYVDIH